MQLFPSQVLFSGQMMHFPLSLMWPFGHSTVVVVSLFAVVGVSVVSFFSAGFSGSVGFSSVGFSG